MTTANGGAAAAPGPGRQTEIYVGGALGKRPALPVDPAALERLAQRSIPEEAFAYVACGAGLESTLKRNRSAFGRWAIVPRMLKDVSVRDSAVDLFGMQLPAPLLLAPIGVQELVHPEADAATARAAASLGVPMIFSNQASIPMEACAEVMGEAPRLFQLYWGKNRDVVASLVSRAETCGCSAIVVTLDTTILGWRTRDLDLAFLPFLKGRGIAQYTSDPVFRATLPVAPEGDAGPAIEQFVRTFSNPALTWDDLRFLRECTRLPILLKGIQHREDARKAIDHGMDGIVVSNHGGRQVDGGISAIEALPAVIDSVDGHVPVLFDSGLRCGADMFKALALGAAAVCLGRPYIYGLAVAGETGVRDVLTNLLAEFDLTMGLAGCRSVEEISPEALQPVA